MIALFWPLAEKLFGQSPQSELTRRGFVVGLMVLLNLPPLLLALSGQSILELLLFAQLLAATIIAPVLLGFWRRTHPHGALAGALAGLVIAMVTCSVGDEKFDQLLQEGGRYRRGWTWAFLATPPVSAAVTVATSVLGFPDYSFTWRSEAAEPRLFAHHADKPVDATSASTAAAIVV